MDGAAQRIERELARTEYGAWLTGQLAGIAVNDPAKYPGADEVISASGRKNKAVAATPEQMKMALQAWTLAFGGEVR